jgi:WD40 repeat protein
MTTAPRWLMRMGLAVAVLLVALVSGCSERLTQPSEAPIPPPEVDVESPSHSRLPMAFSADSVWFYYVSQGKLISYNLQTKDVSSVPLPAQHPSIALAATKLFRADTIRAGTFEDKLFVADVGEGKVSDWVELTPGRWKPNWVAASPAGDAVTLVTDYEERVPNGHTVGGQRLEIFDSRTPNERRELLTNKVHQFYPPKFSADGRFFVLPDAENNTVNIWQASSGQLIRAIPCGLYPPGYALSADGSLVAFGGHDEQCHLWSVGEGRQISTWQVPAPIECIEFHSGGTLIVGCNHPHPHPFALHHASKATLWVRDGTTGKVRVIRAFDEGYLHGLMISPDGRYLAAVGEPFTQPERVRLWRWDQLVP